jgi:hypothetical protein
MPKFLKIEAVKIEAKLLLLKVAVVRSGLVQRL